MSGVRRSPRSSATRRLPPASGTERSPGNRADVIALDLGRSHPAFAPEVIGAYLVMPAAGSSEHALVDCGPGSTAEVLLDAVREAGVDPASVRHLLVTHVHLDHAGAAGRLARELGLRVHAHARGTRHLARPERLLESARRVFGTDLDRLWGDMGAVPEEQLAPLEGGETLHLGGHAIGVLATPGHASHHVCFALGDAVFTGDVGGIRLGGSGMVVPPTPPPDIDLEAWQASLRLLRAYDAGRLMLAHYGEVRDVSAHLDSLETSLERFGELSRAALEAGEGRDGIARRLRAFIEAGVGTEPADAPALRYEMASPYLMAADGLERYWRSSPGRQSSP